MKLIISCILVLLVQVPSTRASLLNSASADEEHRMLSKRRVKKPFARDCTIVESKDEVGFSCRATNMPDEDSISSDSEDASTETRGIVLEPAIEIRDKIKYKVETGKKGAKVKIEYEQEYEQEYLEEDGSSEEVSGESSAEFEVVFESIIEYAKQDTAQNTSDELAYNWEEDAVVQTLPLDDWNPLSTVMSDAEGVVSHFLATSSDQIVAFNFTISRSDVGEKLSANSMKIDVHIVNFPWQRNDTYLALLSSVSSELEVDVKYDEEATVLLAQQDVQIPFASAIDTIGFVPYGSYTWETMAEVAATDGTVLSEPTGSSVQKSVVGGMGPSEVQTFETIKVVAVSPIDGSSNETSTSSIELSEKIAYSFVGSGAQNATYIYWDPEAGIGYTESDHDEYVIIGSNGAPMDFMTSAAFSLYKTGALMGLIAVMVAVLGW